MSFLHPRRVLPWFLSLACLPAGTGSAVPPAIHVEGRVIPAAGVVTVSDALEHAHVVVPSGRVLSVVTHRPIAGDSSPGTVLVDGRPAATSSRVEPGAYVTVVPGRDATEPVQVVSVPVQARTAALFVGGHPGRAKVVRGALSGETVSRKLLAQPRRGRLVTPGALALTFDDGPDPAWTPRVLAILAAAKVHATFCLIGRQVKAHPELVRAIVAGGHTLCNHTWDHDESLATSTPAHIAEEMARTSTAIFAATGRRPTLFRAPGGSWSPLVESIAASQGMTPLWWDVDPHDWARPGVGRIVSTVLREVRPGRIVLLHDGGGDRIQTLAALSFLLKRLPAMGYSFQLPRG